MIPVPLENGLMRLQRSFADAILLDDSPIPTTVRAASGPAASSRFGVYRNNVIAGLIKAVAARYPVVRKLLWDDSFDRAARLYIATEPPRSPVLLEYGESFPRFLRRVGDGNAADYLADIAELESARTRAYHAADATPLGRDAFAALRPDRLAALRVTLHPSVTLLRSRFPVVSIWEANLSDNDNTLTEWREEAALVARPHLHVEVHRLPPGVYGFLAALTESSSFGAAIERAAALDSDFDLATAFATLISSGIVIGFAGPEPASGGQIA